MCCRVAESIGIDIPWSTPADTVADWPSHDGCHDRNNPCPDGGSILEHDFEDFSFFTNITSVSLQCASSRFTDATVESH